MTKSIYEQQQEAVAKKQRAALDKLLAAAGRQITLAEELKVDRQMVHNWVARGRISATGACLVEQHPVLAKVVTKEELRPDVTDWQCKTFVKKFREEQNR